MMIIPVLLTFVVLYVFGRVLVRYLGWPTSFAAIGRWLAALVVAGAISTGLPGLVRGLRFDLGPAPAIDAGELLCGLFLLGLATLGYVGWTRGELVREQQRQEAARTRRTPRHPALPPAPSPTVGAPVDDGFAPIVAPPGDDEE